MPDKYFIKKAGILKAHGKDLIDFLNRMSANDLRKFPPGEFRKTVLTTDKGRIIDLINVLNFKNRSLIITSNNFEEKVKSHLDKYIIMDDVSLVKDDSENFQFTIFTNNSSEAAKKYFDLGIEKNNIYEIGGDEFLFSDNFRIETLKIICKGNRIEYYRNLFSKLSELSGDEYEYLRITSGMPEGENEFNDNINPVECGLGQYISYTKGCYIGQEVIARLDSQGKIPKQMVKINSDSLLENEGKIFSEDEKESGFISSSIERAGKYYGLGFIRSVNLDFTKNYFFSNNGKKFKLNIEKINQ